MQHHLIGMFVAFAVLSTLTANASADTARRPLLVFEIDEGFPTSLLACCKDDIPTLDACLNNICSSLSPLTARYDVAVLIYPTHVYDRSAAEPIDRFHPVLRHTLDYFQKQGRITVILEAYSSGIHPVREAPLHDRPDDKGRIGWAMDLEALAALKDAYPNTLKGIRFHELYGSNLISQINNSRPFLDEEVVRGTIDLCREKRLFLLWSDSCWLMKSPPTTGQPSYVYDEKYKPCFQAEPYRSLQDYAEEQLGSNLCFSWANNNYHFTPNLGFWDAKVGPSKPGVEHPLPDWLYYSMPFKEFPLKLKGQALWGMSIQSWFWHELTNTLNRRYYALGENNCPVEILQAYVLKGLREGASVLQFEPSWYFFNEDLAVYGPKLGVYAQKPDRTETLVMKRLTHTLLHPDDPSNPPHDLSAIFDRNQQRFLENSLSNPPCNYSQSTLLVAETGKPLQCYDSYSYGPRWMAQSRDRYGEWLFGGDVLSIHRIELQGDGIDDILIVKRDAHGRLTAELYDQNSVRIGDCGSILDDNSEGRFVGLTTANLVPEVTACGDPDEIIVARRSGDRLNLRVYKATPESDGRTRVEYRPLTDKENHRVLGGLMSERSGFVGLLGIRREAVMYSDFSRSLDIPAVVYRNGSSLCIRAFLDGKISEWKLAGSTVLTLDSNLDRKDDLCAIRRSGRQTVVDVYKLDGRDIVKAGSHRISAISQSAHAVGLRKCILVSGGARPLKP